jgi:hypothetical protein
MAVHPVFPRSVCDALPSLFPLPPSGAADRDSPMSGEHTVDGDAGRLLSDAALGAVARRLPASGQLLACAAVSRFASELFADLPVLFALLVERWSDADGRPSSFARLVTQKRDRLLGYALNDALPEAGSALKFLRRLDFETLSQGDLMLVRRFLSDSRYRMFRHRRSIPFELLALVDEFPFLAETRWLSRLRGAKGVNAFKALLRSLLEFAGQVGVEEATIRHIVNARDVSAVKKKRSELKESLQFADTLGLLPEFPAPPFAGAAWIRPIVDERALYLHGVQQQNCVHDYTDRVRSGEYYIYRVEGERVCTLGIEIDPYAGFSLDQVEGAGNSAAPDSDVARIEHYLRALEMSRFERFDRHRAQFLNARNDELMTRFEEYCRAFPRQRNVRFMAGYRHKQYDQVMQAYADYSQRCGA